jgi:hypothetical protein
MIALSGHPPPELLARLHSMREYQWPEPVKTADCVTYDSAEQYFGGPFFDRSGIWNPVPCITKLLSLHVANALIIGKFMYEDLIPDRNLADTLPLLEEKERKKFLSFAKMMLAWIPEERKTSRELMEHPFLQRSKKPSN